MVHNDKLQTSLHNPLRGYTVTYTMFNNGSSIHFSHDDATKLLLVANQVPKPPKEVYIITI